MSIIGKILIPVRWAFLAGGLSFYYLEMMGNWFINYNKKTEYIRMGGCKKCGECCKLLAIQYPNFFNRFPRLINATIKWHQYRYRFTYLNSEANYFLYECNMPAPDKTCGCYHSRPRICREYPKTKLYGKTHTHLNCGFYFARRDGKPTFDAALHKANEKHHV